MGGGGAGGGGGGVLVLVHTLRHGLHANTFLEPALSDDESKEGNLLINSIIPKKTRRVLC